jgi:hypothetical protein
VSTKIECIKGHKPWNWTDKPIIASNGYVLVFVGKDHHLADIRGYAYQHRVIAEQFIGRRLRPQEQVHHINNVKTDNRPENIEIMPSLAHHRVRHRKHFDRRLPNEDNPPVSCACGCGLNFLRYDTCGRPRRYVTGHNIHPRKEVLYA